MTRIVFLGVRRVDPNSGLNDVVDLVVDDGTVIHVGPVGTGKPLSESASCAHVIDEPELVVCPGLVDIHSHVFGAAGLADADAIGVRAGVPTIVDAGGAGTATIDDFVACVVDRSDTRVLSFLSIESGGIVEPDPAHNTRRLATEMVTPSLGDFLPAIERHTDHIVGLKVWASGAAGLPWIDHAVAMADLTSLPLLVHIGDVDAHDQPDRIVDFGDTVSSGEILDRLQAGDIVTHCFTGLPGALVDAAGRISPEVLAARHRGVLFDPAPGSINLRLSRAVAALRQGWMPDIISSDLHRWSWDQPHRSIVDVMNLFLALGMRPDDVIERASVRPASAIGLTTGSPSVGSSGDLSVLRFERGRVVHTDGVGGSISGTNQFVAVGCVRNGAWFEASTDAHAEESAPLRLLSDDERGFLDALRIELVHHHAVNDRWCGDDLHRLVQRARAAARVSVAGSVDALSSVLGDERLPIAAGWLLESVGPAEAIARLEAVAEPRLTTWSSASARSSRQTA